MVLAADNDRIEHEWTVDEYFRLGERDVFGDRRTELIGGKIYDKTPPAPHKANLIMWLNSILMENLGSAHFVRVQLPLELGHHSAPEPDFAIVPKTALDPKHHPQAADLVIEIADSSLAFDRGKKASLYASAGVPEYWVMNVAKRRLELFRGPEADSVSPFQATYREKRVLEEVDSVTLVNFPEVTLAVSTLFGPR